MTSLTRVAGDAERVRVSVDGEPVGFAPAAALAGLGVGRGARLDEAAARGLADAIDVLGARRMALRILRGSTRSRAEVERRVRAAGHSAGAVSAAIGAATEAGLIDDERLARLTAERFAEQPRGGARLLGTRLARRGIERPVASRAVEGVAAELDESTIALRLARSRVARARPGDSDDALARRTSAFLARRGLGGAVCRDAVRKALAERAR